MIPFRARLRWPVYEETQNDEYIVQKRKYGFKSLLPSDAFQVEQALLERPCMRRSFSLSHLRCQGEERTFSCGTLIV